MPGTPLAARVVSRSNIARTETPMPRWTTPRAQSFPSVVGEPSTVRDRDFRRARRPVPRGVAAQSDRVGIRPPRSANSAIALANSCSRGTWITPPPCWAVPANYRRTDTDYGNTCQPVIAALATAPQPVVNYVSRQRPTRRPALGRAAPGPSRRIGENYSRWRSVAARGIHCTGSCSRSRRRRCTAPHDGPSVTPSWAQPATAAACD